MARIDLTALEPQRVLEDPLKYGIMVYGESGSGKALPNSTTIPTPNGPKQVGELKVGDYLFDVFGKPTKILGVFPQGQKPVWKLVLKDGREALCSPEHLWSYHTGRQRRTSIENRKFRTNTLEEIKEKGLSSKSAVNNILLPMQYAVEYEEKEFSLPPYVLGLILGDGSFRRAEKGFEYSSEDDTLPNIIAETMNWTTKKNHPNNFTYRFYFNEEDALQKQRTMVQVRDILENYPELWGLYSGEKFIPEEYMFGSIEQRFELLRGLLDTDGSVDNSGRVGFYTNSKKMVLQVQELCRSLGFKAAIGEDTHKENINYCLTIAGKPEEKLKLFSLPRKLKRIKDWQANSKRKIFHDTVPVVDIIDMEYETEMTCFYVDNPEHLFLMNDYIVTHNTSLIAQAPRTLIIDTEDGALAIAGIMRQPVYSWSEFLQALNQLRKKEVKDMFDIIAIDTIDSLAFMLEQHILQVNNIESMSDLHFSAAYSQAKQAMKKAFNTIRTLGYSLLIAGHNKKAVDDDNQKIKYQDLAMPNYIAQIVKKEMSAILYVESNRYGERAVHYFMDPDYYAKCKFKYAEPTTEFSFEAIYNNLKASIEKEQEVSGIYGNNDKAEKAIGSGQHYGDTEVNEEDFIEPEGWDDYQKMKDLCQKVPGGTCKQEGPMVLDDIKLLVGNSLGGKKVIEAEAADLEALRNIYRGMFKLNLN